MGGAGLFGRGPVPLGGGLAACAMGIVVHQHGDDRRPGGSANQWTAIQRGLDELLVSPAVKRRAGIELRRIDVDADVVAAVEMVDECKRSLKSV